MKKLIIIFILVSSPVFAGDDLTGKKIFCAKKYEDGYISGLAFDFKNKREVWVWHQTDEVDLVRYRYEYKAYGKSITVGSTTHPEIWKIDRTNLSMKYLYDYSKTEKYKYFDSKFCKVEKRNLDKLFEDLFSEKKYKTLL